MKKIYITGSSSGIGLALAKAATAAGHKVEGFSRRNKLEHPAYKHHTLDLSIPENLGQISFEGREGAQAMVLVNNAGTLGDVKPVDRLNPEKIDRAYRLNLTAPSILTRQFLAHTAGFAVPRMVLNISSGAGSYPIRGWSTYCASKAAIDMFTRVLRLDHPEVFSWAVGPGVVDTEMQGEIRRTPASDFPEVGRFVDYKEQGELNAPEDVARKLLYLLDHPEDFPEACFSLRDLNIPPSQG